MNLVICKVCNHIKIKETLDNKIEIITSRVQLLLLLVLLKLNFNNKNNHSRDIQFLNHFKTCNLTRAIAPIRVDSFLNNRKHRN